MTGQASNGSSLRLQKAIAANDIPLVERLLQANPHLLHNPDFEDKSNTSLHLAAQAGHVELCEFLVSKGHDQSPEVIDYIYSSSDNNLGISLNTDGHTPLHLAASKLHVDTIELLCKLFPSTVNRGDKQGRTPLLLAAGAQISPTTKVVAGRKNTLHTEDIRAIEALLRHGADVRAKDHDGNTCLHQACAWGNLKTARVLVQAGADPAAPNNAGWKPDAYSLSVQADVYFRNLVAEFGRQKAYDVARQRDDRRNHGGGQVRLVTEPEIYNDNDNDSDFFDAESGRGRAGSGRSDTSVSRFEERPLGLNIR